MDPKLHMVELSNAFESKSTVDVEKVFQEIKSFMIYKLEQACKNGSLEIAQSIIKYNNHITFKDLESGKIFKNACCSSKTYDIVKWLIEHFNLKRNDITKNNNLLLRHVCKGGTFGIFEIPCQGVQYHN